MAGTTMTTKQLSPDVPDSRYNLLRSPSTSSDVTTRSIHISVPSAQPAPAYVASSSACDLLVEELQQAVLVSRSALSLVNEFLDQVLYNVLLASRSTSLSALKAAVPTVLKPRLGKAALKVAEQELEEYINDDDELELQKRKNSVDLKHDFDCDLAWRLARLRCMVYTRLGDLEEEDEEEWLENEGLRVQLQSFKQSAHSSVETGPASAIFLTSIIEYLGEQALYYAAQHAQKRHHQYGNQQIREEETEYADLPDHEGLVVGGRDMNHVGRDSPLSRLWRSYRRNTRDSSSRPMSPEFRNNRGLGLSHSRTPSSVPYEALIIEEERSPDQIPLPMAGNDVDQIEVPGLAPPLSDEEDDSEQRVEDTAMKRRPASMVEIPSHFPEELNISETEPPEIPERSPLRPLWMRKRSISTPVTTLAKISASRRESIARVEAYLRDTGSRRPSLYKEHHSHDSSEAAFGGAVPSVAGALGLGALGVSDQARQASRADTGKPLLLANEAVQSRTAQPKRTAAEEMLGTTPSAPLPIDASTGSSITNTNDFLSMHVPPEMSPGALEDLTPRAENINPMNAVISSGTAQDSLRPAPLRTLSAMHATDGASAVGTSYEGVYRSSLEDRSNIPNGDPVTAESGTDLRSQQTDYHHSRAITPVPTTGAMLQEPVQIKHVKPDQYSSADTSHSRNSSAGSRLLGAAKDLINRPSTLSQPRTPGAATEEVRRTNSPSALSMTRDTRSETGSSSVSKRFHGKPLQLGDDSDEAKKKSLEILIRGNETLHYTLTPAAAMRDEVSVTDNVNPTILTSKQPSTTQKVRTPNQDIAEFLRNTGPRAEESTSRVRPVGVSTNLPEPPSSPRRIVQRIVSSSSPRGMVTPASPTRSINPLGEPRDPRAEPVTSTRDLADYARSTGPSDRKQLPLALPVEAAKSTSPRSATVSPRVDSYRQDVTSPTSNRPASRLKYQARDARTSQANDTSELIDFIREGPQNPGKEHRIDRKVAPFRTTMDSEDFDNLGQDQGQGIASLRESEDDRHTSSVDPSVTSQTPLIVTNGRNTQRRAPAAPVEQQIADSDGMPKRTRRRIKDPYAIYDSDDDDDLEAETSRRDNRNQEESLIDFLKNTEPPSTMKPQPILAARPISRATEQLATNGPRPDSPHLTQSGKKMDKYRPTQPTHAAHVDRNRATISSTPVSSNNRNSSKPRFEARDAKATRAGTAELAEYLKNSGPPPSAQYKPQPFILSVNSSQQPKPQSASASAPALISVPSSKDDKGIFKRFSRSKR